jgi:hypothetical protein
MDMNMFVFKLGLVFFWGLWLLIVFLTNLFEGLKALRILPPYWRFASQNFQAVAQATATYHAPPWVPRLLFFGVLCWQIVALLFFGRALVFSIEEGAPASGPLNAAFASSLGLLAAFMIADEICKQYDTERAHILFFIAQLVTWLALYVLPST